MHLAATGSKGIFSNCRGPVQNLGQKDTFAGPEVG